MSHCTPQVQLYTGMQLIRVLGLTTAINDHHIDTKRTLVEGKDFLFCQVFDGHTDGLQQRGWKITGEDFHFCLLRCHPVACVSSMARVEEGKPTITSMLKLHGEIHYPRIEGLKHDTPLLRNDSPCPCLLTLPVGWGLQEAYAASC